MATRMSLRGLARVSVLRNLHTTRVAPKYTDGTGSTGGGFGEKERQEHQKSKPYDQAPYQNEYTRTGTHEEVSHSEEAYSRNTNPEKSLRESDGALEGSGANADWSKNYRPNKSNKTHRDPSTASGHVRAGGDGAENGAGANADAAQSKFEKLEREGTEDKRYIGYTADKRK
ncbi:hypothetical protein PYCC9005_003634 [Savitreella phatthalungensis]